MAKRESISVVIPTYNRAIYLNKCLDSLLFQTNYIFEVLIADGGSTDKTLEVIDKFKKKLPIRTITIRKKHLSYVRDRLWREAKGTIIASIDDDTIVSSTWAKVLSESFQDVMIGGLTGPTIIPKAKLNNRIVFKLHNSTNLISNIASWVYFHLFMQGERYEIGKIYPSGAWSPGSNFILSSKLNKPIHVDYLEACNFAVRKKLLYQIGGFDLGYTGTSEWCEIDMAFKIRKLGYTLLFHPRCSVRHLISTKGVYVRRINISERVLNLERFYWKMYFPKTYTALHYISFTYAFLPYHLLFFRFTEL